MTDGERMPVGFIGLGVMGSILAGRLLAAGFRVVVYNRTQARQAPLVEQGATAAESPLALARRCRHVFTAVTGPQALEEILCSAHGICGGGPVATETVCDLSTQDPQALVSLGAVLRGRGIVLTESPMAGSVHDAMRGTLQFMQGGDRQRLASLAGYFACWGPAPIHFGELGQATTAKLALNLLLGLMAAGLGDALQLLRNAGVSEQAFVDVLAASGLRSPVYPRLWERHCAGDYEARFSLDNLRKDAMLAGSHAGWGGDPPGLVRALAERLRDLPAERLPSDYSRLLQEAAAS